MSKRSTTDIRKLLKEAAGNVLTEETLDAIELAVEKRSDEKARLQVESAVEKLDEDYAGKLEQLLEAIDRDSAYKMRLVVEAMDKKHTMMLKKVINKHNKVIVEDARTFKNRLVKTLSKYLIEYVDDAIPTESINEAVKNRKAAIVLENLKKSLGVSSMLMKESVKEAIFDGHRQITTLRKKNANAVKTARVLKEKLDTTTGQLLIEQRIKSLPTGKQEYMRRMLTNKSPEFIVENFNYILKLYDQEKTDRREVLKEEAVKSRKTVDVAQDPREVIKEQHISRPTHDSTTATYLGELSKY